MKVFEINIRSFSNGDTIKIENKKYKVMKKIGKKPWLKRIYEAVKNG